MAQHYPMPVGPNGPIYTETLRTYEIVCVLPVCDIRAVGRSADERNSASTWLKTLLLFLWAAASFQCCFSIDAFSVYMRAFCVSTLAWLSLLSCGWWACSGPTSFNAKTLLLCGMFLSGRGLNAWTHFPSFILAPSRASSPTWSYWRRPFHSSSSSRCQCVAELALFVFYN